MAVRVNRISSCPKRSLDYALGRIRQPFDILPGMHRGDLTDAQWVRRQSLLPPPRPPQGSKGGRPRNADRPISNGILWILRTGAPWPAVPTRYGPPSTVSTRLYRWKQAGSGTTSSLPCKLRPMPLVNWTGNPIMALPPSSVPPSTRRGQTRGSRDGRPRAQPRRLQHQGPSPLHGHRQAHHRRAEVWRAACHDRL